MNKSEAYSLLKENVSLWLKSDNTVIFDTGYLSLVLWRWCRRLELGWNSVKNSLLHGGSKHNSHKYDFYCIINAYNTVELFSRKNVCGYAFWISHHKTHLLITDMIVLGPTSFVLEAWTRLRTGQTFYIRKSLIHKCSFCMTVRLISAG